MRNLRMYDSLTPEEAIVRAWRDEGISSATHEKAKKQVAKSMPILARAIDRLEKFKG